jgi:hypothetical protein
MLSDIMMIVIMLSVITMIDILSVIECYAHCHDDYYHLCVVMLSVVGLNVVAQRHALIIANKNL